MASELSISQILSIAQVCEYLNVVRTSLSNLFTGGDISENRARLIYMERMGIQNRYNLSPNDPALPGAANYLFSILRYQSDAQNILNNQAVAGPVLTGPSNQSVNVAASATFTVSATGVAPFLYQWFDSGGNPILGATSSSYVFPNAQLSDTGKTFFAKVTDANGKQVTSGVATLTVTAAIVGFYFQGVTDYSTLLLAGTDTVPYLGTFPITSGQPLLVTFPDATDTETIVVKYPATETTKNNFLNPPPSGPDAGSIPSLSLEGTSFGGWKYIFSRTGTTFGVNSVNKQVQFS